MARNNNSNIPSRCVRITTYREFFELVKRFAAGGFKFLIILGKSGISKSVTLRKAVEAGGNLYVETTASAVGLYQLLYKYRDKLVVIDDLDSIFKRPDAVPLLKSLCNTDPIKRLCWFTNFSGIDDNDPDKVPHQFTTTSSVCLIANSFSDANVNLAAIADRAIIVHFDPPSLATHQLVGTWFHKDDEVYNFVGDSLHLIPHLSIRLYEQAKELKDNKFPNWRKATLSLAGVDGKMLAIWELQNDPNLKTENDRAAAFQARGHGARSTYFEWKKKMPPRIDVDITVTVKAPKVRVVPPTTPTPDFSVFPAGEDGGPHLLPPVQASHTGGQDAA